MRIQHNIMAMSAYRNYTNNVSAMKKNLEKLSSGYKINRAGDDAAGLAISEKMRAQITGLETAQKNAKDGISLVQTAEGALTEVHDMLNRMVELATQSANGTYDNTTDRAQLQKEMDQLRSEINRIADSSNFNGIKLLDGSMTKAGATSPLQSFELPATSTGEVGSGTIKHKEPIGDDGGTRFSVDLHDAQFAAKTGNTYTLTAGDLEITLQGKATASTASALVANASDIVKLLTTGSSSKFTIGSVKVAGTTITSGISASGVITGTKYGDITITKDTKGSNRITFQQKEAPTKANGLAEWEGARSVSIKHTDVDGATSPMNNDHLISLMSEPVGHATTPAAAALGSKVTLSAAKASVTGTIATALASTDTGVANLSASVAISASAVAAKGIAGTISLAVAGSTTKSLVLKVGSKVIATSSTAIASLAQSGTQAYSFGSLGTVTLKAASGQAVTKAAIEGIASDMSLTASISVTPAVEANITPASDTSAAILTDEFVKASAAKGDIMLKASGSSGSATWTLSVGSKIVNATVSASGVVKVGSAAVFTIGSSANHDAIQKAAVTGIKVGTFTPTSSTSSSASKASIASDAFGSTGKDALDKITSANGGVGSTGFFKQETVATIAPVTLTSVVATAVAGAINGKAVGSTIGSTSADALKNAVIKVGDVTATFGTIASTATVGDVLQQIVDKLNAAAAAKAKADYTALGSSGAITIYHDFKFVNGTGAAVTQAAGDQTNYSLTYKTTTLSTTPQADAPSGSNPVGRDYNFGATDINTVKADGGQRLASTYIDKADLKDVVKDGGEIMLGGKNNTYTFTTDLTLKDTGNNVYIGDLVDEKGNLTDANLNIALERLTDAADGNDMYTVGYDKGRLTLTEKGTSITGSGWPNGKYNDGERDYDLSNEQDIKASLGFKAPATKGNGGLKLQIGDTADSYNQLVVDIKDMHTWSMGSSNKSINDISIADQDSAAEAVDVIKAAINYVSDVRGTLGATQNRLDHTINNLSVMTENIQDAESTIRDVDVAEEMMAYTKNNILIQSAQAMLAQANQVPQGVLQLLQ